MARLPWFRVFLSVLVCSILCINALFVFENGRLRKRLSAMTDHVEINPGDIFPSFNGVDLTGRLKQVEFGQQDKRFLMILVSAGCPACLANVENWVDLVQGLDPDEWEVMWLSRDPWEKTREFALERGFTGHVLSEFSTREYRQVGLRLVPRTIIVSPNGVVENIWVGRLEEEQWSDVSNHLFPEFDIALQ